MDFGAFVQENRRWLLGCGIGFLVFLIAYIVIGSVYDAQAPMGGLSQLRKGLPGEVYNASVRDALRTEAEQLDAEAARLQQQLAYTRTGAFDVPAGANAGEFLLQKGHELKQMVLDGANERNVAIEDKNVGWNVPLGGDEIRHTLFGLELMDQTIRRLYAASDAVRAADPEAVGLSSVQNLRTDSKAQSQSLRARQAGSGDLRDRIEQERVQFKFEADAPTILRFFEACRVPGSTLVVDNLQMVQPPRIGDPVIVTGTVSGVAFKKEQP